MIAFLTLAYLFFIGSVGGWVLEVFFRKFFSSSNPEHRWINPGFCTGPYLPIYGFGLCALYLLASVEALIPDGGIAAKIWLFLAMAVSMTAIEYLAGIICLKCFNLRLWDYSNMWGNFQGLICPLFSFFWAALGAGYYFLVHPHILDALQWLSDNLAFSFVIGYFFGVFTLDVTYSGNLVAKMRRFAKENDVIVRFENIKNEISSFRAEHALRPHFLLSFHSPRSIQEHLKDALENAKESARSAIVSRKEDWEKHHSR